MMTVKNNHNAWISSALKVNLERTAATVEIPARFAPLLQIVEKHYGVRKKMTELLTELHHPYVNWDDVLKELKSVSIGDFYIFNGHAEGPRALSMLLDIYFDVILSAASEDVKDSAIRYLFDYADAVVGHSNEHIARNLTLLAAIIDFLLEAADRDPALFKKCSAYLKRLVRSLEEKKIDFPSTALDDLLYRMFTATYEYWLAQPDPSRWVSLEDGETEEAVRAYLEITLPLSHQRIRALLADMASQKTDNAGRVRRRDYLAMTDYFQMVNAYLLAADQLEKSPAFAGHSHLAKLNFLFGVMTITGLADIHAAAMREINHSLKMVFQEEKKEDLGVILRRIFVFLKKSARHSDLRFASMDCIVTTAREVFARNNHPLAEIFMDELIAYGFQYPQIQGSTTDWQVRVNPEHIRSIRAWLEIIGLKPRWTKRLISALIIHLKIGGVFVRDTDLIQRDISRLLNTDIAPAYNLIKQLGRLFPVYFSEIGAEGELRDITTRIDELSFRKDRLIDFFRKQSHVESNSLLVGFAEDIFRYWHSGDKTFIHRHIPGEVYDEVANAGEYFDGMHLAFVHLLAVANGEPRRFLEWDADHAAAELSPIAGLSEIDRERASLMIRIYQLIHKKYHPQYFDLLNDLESQNAFAQSDILSLKRALKSKNYRRSLTILIRFMNLLKDKILSAEKTQSFENIYYKRHIAAGIPSMYGTYHEEKFDALGLSLRLESLATMLFEELIQSLNLKFITKYT
ncbi:MAG: hypothetical protein R6W75_09780, partial [Smithellaceae bacterium]